jgi:hypothetical protein
MKYREVPAFLAGGTFLRNALGYSYREPPTLDLLALDALDSDNPWIVLAATLEHAKIGDWNHLARLSRLMDPGDDPLLVGSCFQLLGDVGARDAVRILQSFLRHESGRYVVRACQALHHVGYLWLVPSMVEAWDRLEWQDDRETVALILSEMLEEEVGPLSSCTEYSPSQYRSVVLRRYEELRSQLGSEKLPVWAGRLFGVVSLVQRMIRLLRLPQITGLSLGADFLDLREKFEASTGTECSGFFVDRQLQVPAALAILETFQKRPESRSYEEGVRYFFGQQVPFVGPA